MSTNALVIDYEFCTGCHTCEVACKKYLELPKGQFGIKILQDGPRQLENGKWELNYLPMPTSLCDLCAGRLAEGKDANCVHHCPAHAMHFGPVEEMAKLVAEKGNRVLFVPTVQ
jgi:Fe-S-cluster-containing dehydrogenase component